MYNFRYHLVTICAVFIALALGLVLGAGLSSSEIASSATDGMVASLLEKYDQVERHSAAVEKQNDSLSTLGNGFAENWQLGRLSGRVIAILATPGENGQTLAKQQSELVKAAGGTPIVVVFSEPDLGSSNAEVVQQLSKLVNPLQDDKLATTLAQALVTEWTVSLQKATGSTHTLTDYLLSAKIITVSVDDINTLNALAALQGVKSPKITAPAGINGTINLLAWSIASDAWQDVSSADDVGLAFAADVQTLGQAGKLPYYIAKTSSLKAAGADANVADDVSYFAVAVQAGVLGDTLFDVTTRQGLSCVVYSQNPLGKYSTVALLSGAKIGGYNLESADNYSLPTLPTDKTGLAAFVRQ